MLVVYHQEYSIKTAIINIQSLINRNSSLTLKTFSKYIQEFLKKTNSNKNSIYSEIVDDYVNLVIKNEIQIDYGMTLNILLNEYRMNLGNDSVHTDEMGSIVNIISLPEKLRNIIDNKTAEALKDFISKIWINLDPQSVLYYNEDDGYVEFKIMNTKEKSNISIIMEF